MIKLIMSDMDGTLLDENGKLPPGFDEVMGELKKRGVLFAPCSGRQYYSLRRTFAGYEDDFLFLAENGTIVKYHDEEIFSCPMGRAEALEVLETAAENPKIYRVFCGKKDAYIRKEQDTEEFRAEFHKYYTHHEVVDDFRDVDDDAIKISLFDAKGRAAQQIFPMMKKFDGPMQVVLSSDWWVDVMAFGINKGIAIQQVQKHLGITPMECAAFGDYMNDAEMMSSVYYSYAVENAHPKIKELARFHTKSNEEYGVLHGIRDLISQGLCG